MWPLHFEWKADYSQPVSTVKSCYKRKVVVPPWSSQRNCSFSAPDRVVLKSCQTMDASESRWRDKVKVKGETSHQELRLFRIPLLDLPHFAAEQEGHWSFSKWFHRRSQPSPGGRLRVWPVWFRMQLERLFVMRNSIEVVPDSIDQSCFYGIYIFFLITNVIKVSI